MNFTFTGHRLVSAGQWEHVGPLRMGGSDAISVLGYERMTLWSYSMVMRNSDSTIIKSVCILKSVRAESSDRCPVLTVHDEWEHVSPWGTSS